MATVINDLTTIQLLIWNSTNKKHDVYNIHAEEISEGDSQDSSKIFTCDSHDAQKVSFGKCEYGIELKGVLQDHKKFFNRLRERQRNGNTNLPKLAIYSYESGTKKLQSWYEQVYVGDIDRTKSEPFDVKLEALSKLYRNSKNELI